MALNLGGGPWRGGKGAFETYSSRGGFLFLLVLASTVEKSPVWDDEVGNSDCLIVPISHILLTEGTAR